MRIRLLLPLDQHLTSRNVYCFCWEDSWHGEVIHIELLATWPKYLRQKPSMVGPIRLATACLVLLFFLRSSVSTRFTLNANATPPRCTEVEKRILYNRLDPSGGGAGISCIDLVSFVEGPADYDGGGAAAAASDMAFAASAVQDEEGGMGKLLRRAQATIVEAAQVYSLQLTTHADVDVLCSGASGVRIQRHIFGSCLSAGLLGLR